MSKPELITGITGQDGTYHPATANLGWPVAVGFKELVAKAVLAGSNSTKCEGRPGS